jgi:phosphopantetheinyl transferase (holo-ACP synthase)
VTDARPPGAAPVTVWVRRLTGAGVNQRVAGDTMLAAMAAAYGFTGVRVARDADGRPLLHGGAEGVHVSISHHHAYVATAITTRGPLGVDVEVVRDLPAQALADRWFAGHEARHLAGLDEPDRPAEFLRLWTVKEAVGKALGTGLRGGGMRRPVGPLPAWPAARTLTLAALAGVDGVAVAGYRDGDLLVAVACRAGDAAGALVSIRRHPARDDRG